MGKGEERRGGGKKKSREGREKEKEGTGAAVHSTQNREGKERKRNGEGEKKRGNLLPYHCSGLVSREKEGKRGGEGHLFFFLAIRPLDLRRSR